MVQLRTTSGVSRPLPATTEAADADALGYPPTLLDAQPSPRLRCVRHATGTIARAAVDGIIWTHRPSDNRCFGPGVGNLPPAVMRWRLLILVVAALVLGVTAVGIARTFGSVGVSVNGPPLVAGAATALSLRTTLDRATHGELTAVELDLARGFRFDPRAADTCSDAQAHHAACPSTSTVGRGTGTIVVQGTYLPRTSYPVSTTFFLGKPRRRGDIAGLVLDLFETQSRLHATLLGSVVTLAHGPYGIAFRFSDTDTELPSGYTLSLLQLTTLLQAHRAVVVSQRNASYDLLTNPVACPTAGWPVQLLVESGRQRQTYRSNAGCRR